jgi:hypothetical protein
MSYDIGLLLDGLILVFLSVTIFYAARLSIFMKTFREGKDAMQLLIRDLSNTINVTENAVQTMKVHAKDTENELREIINEAKFLSDELRFMNETGDSLADRLEKLADRNRELVDLMENAGGIGTQKITPYDPVNTKPAQPKKPLKPAVVKQIDPFEISDFEIDDDDEHDFYALEDGAYREEEAVKKRQEHKSKVNTESKSKVRSFAIFDRDHMDDEDFQEDDNPYTKVANVQEEEVQKFHSQAERDLYEALQRKKRAGNNKRVSEIT